jgi:transaldolase
MDIFLDTANIDDIKRFSPILDGVTTNPSLVAKENLDFRELVGIISKQVPGPISVEVISLDVDGMVEEAKKFASISPNIVIKIPMTFDGLKATKILSEMGIKTNVTLIFSVNQALLAAKAGATYASIFVGRLDDLGQDGIEVVRTTAKIYNQFDSLHTKVLAASIRHPMHVINAAEAGSHAATIPPKVLEQMMTHNLTHTGLEQFLNDWNCSPNTV